MALTSSPSAWCKEGLIEEIGIGKQQHRDTAFAPGYFKVPGMSKEALRVIKEAVDAEEYLTALEKCDVM